MSRPRLGLLGTRSPTFSLVRDSLTAQEEARIVTASFGDSTRIEAAATRRRRDRRLGVFVALLALSAFVTSPTEGQHPEGDQFQVNTYTTGAQLMPAAATNGSEGFVVAWTVFTSPGSSIRARRYSADGLALGSEFQVNTYADVGYRIAAGANGAGGFVVVWPGDESPGDDIDDSVQARLYAADGSPSGEQFQVNSYTTGIQRYPSVGPAGSGFIVVWASSNSSGVDNNWSIQAQLYTADGSPAGDQFQVNTTPNLEQDWPAVGPASDGFVVAWHSEGTSGTDTNDSIVARRYAADGVPLSGEFQVNTYTTAGQFFPAVGAAHPDGFVIAWTSEGSSGSDTSERSIQAQRYSADGQPLGEEFQVNSYTTADQDFPSVSADGGGGFVIAWTSEGSSGSDTDDTSVQAQRYSPNGQPRGAEFQVNSYTTYSQGFDSTVAPDGGGGFVVAWTSGGSYGDDTDGSIQGQRYAVTLFADGFESGDTSQWSATVP